MSENLMPTDKFVFSMKLADEMRQDLTSKVSTLNERIEKISEAFTVGDDIPIIRPILNVTRSKEDLKKLSKALDRIADIIELHDSLSRKLSVIEIAQSDPQWFVSSFADFETDIDKTINQIISENK